ncbi:peptidoglycan binding domain-containing protein [Nostoc sp. NIES-2111]|nr:peptidoglycan binding domain-containing protein [Nostoc sp. NIES-2111]
MNWKVIALAPVLALAAALPGYSVTKDKNHAANTATHVAQASQKTHTAKMARSLPKANIKHQSNNVAQSGSIIKVGSKGETVKTAQNLLKQKGFYTASVNGVFDNKTRAAVIKFQKSKGLRADGVIGNRTLAALK